MVPCLPGARLVSLILVVGVLMCFITESLFIGFIVNEIVARSSFNSFFRFHIENTRLTILLADHESSLLLSCYIYYFIINIELFYGAWKTTAGSFR